MIGKKINQLATELAPVSTDLTIIGDPTTGVSKKITLAQLGAIFSGAVSFYNDFASFPATGDINVIYCAKDTKKLYLWSGSAYVEVFPSQALLDTYQLRSEKGNANGYASLDSSGKVPISQLPSSIMEYKGTWSASTNTPTLANGTGDTGDVYICNSPGSVNFGAGAITFAIGDYVIYSGTIWQRSSGAVGTVTSVGLSITGDSIGVTGSPITTSGTLALAFAGTGAQYIKGDGTLATFPSIISQAQNLVTEVYNKTGATLTKGTVVYINGGQGNLPAVTKALATGDSTSAQTYGIVRNDITNNNNGYVVVAGRISDLDTQAYTEGTQLYLSPTTAGTFTSTKPYAPNHLVYVGIVVRAHPTQGVIEVKIQNGYEMDELHNVAAQTPSNNDGLFWEASTSLWKNKSIATILGYTPQAQLNGTGFVKASGTTITYDNSTYVTTDTFQTISASKTFSVGLSLASAGGTNQLTSFINTSSLFSGSGGSNVLGFNSANNIYFGKGLDNGGVIQWNNSAVRYYTLPDATGTIALVGGSGVGTVTSVGLSSATSGVTIGSSPITTSGTITLAIATASGSQQGLLSSTDWTTFNNKQSALTNPVTGTGTTNYLPKFTGISTIGNSVIQEASGSIGINVSPVADLQVGKTSGVTIAMSNSSSVTSGTRGGLSWYNSNVSTVADIRAVAVTDNVGTQLEFYIRPVGGSLTQAMTLSASGNLGLGVTPSAWGSNSFAFQTQGGAVWSFSSAYMDIWQNSYYNGASSIYQTTAGASFYRQTSGRHEWNTAPSGTAGTAISWTQAMTLNASGNLSIGNTNDTYKLDVSGTGRFQAPSGTQENIIVKSANTGFSKITIDAVTGASSQLAFLENGSQKGVVGYRPSTGNVFLANATSDILTIASTGAATFSSSVTAKSSIAVSNNGAESPILSATSTFADGYRATLRLSNTHTGGKAWEVYSTNDSDGGYGGGKLAFVNTTNSVNAMTLTGAGNVGIGTTSPQNVLDLGAASNGNGLTWSNYSNLFSEYSSGALWMSSNFYGNIGSGGYKTSLTATFGAAAIKVSGTSGSGNSGLLQFYVDDATSKTAGASFTPTERMRITSGGNTIINPVGGNGVYSQSLLTIKASVADGNQIHMVQFNDDRGWRMKAQDNGHFYLQSTYQNSNSTVITANYDTGLVQFATGIKTGAPTNGTAETWRLGNAVSGSISTNSYIIVSVNGTTYSIPALNGLP